MRGIMQPGPRIGVSLPVVVACALAISSSVRAAEDPELHIRKGVELRKLGRDEAALPEFQAAYDLAKTGRSAGQLGLCEQALGRWTESADHLAEALEHRTDPWIAKNRSILENSLAVARGRVASIEVIGDPPGAEVLVAGKVVARLPMSGGVTVNAGAVDVELRATGYKRAARTLTVTAGQYQRVVIRLDREAVASSPGLDETKRRTEAGKLAIVPDTQNQSPALALTAEAPAADTPGSKAASHWYFWAGAVVLAGVAASAVLLVSSRGSASTPIPGNTNPDHVVVK